MLPRLRAEESLLESNRTALGSGVLSREDASKLGSRWERVANNQGGPTAQRATPQVLGAMGIGVRRVATPPPEPAGN